MKKKYNKYLIIVLFIVILILVSLGVNYIIKTINYHKTYEYKFIKLGYTANDTKLLDKLSDKSKNYILTLKYDKDIINLINQKYFIEDNLKEYLEYDNTDEYPLIDIVAIVNTHANKEWYSDTKKTDISKGNLMLTN